MKEKKENRGLTKDEQKRLARFEERAAELAMKGYTQTELVVSSVKANVIGPLYGLALAVPFVVLFLVFYVPQSVTGGDRNLWSFPEDYFFFLTMVLLAIPVHELIHGLTFCLFTKGKFKSLAFGFNKQALAPYCSCTEELTKRQYMTGLLAPCLLLGILPGIAAVILSSVLLLLFSIVMLMSAGGDLLIAQLLLRHKATGDVLYIDHPTKIGLSCFERGKNVNEKTI